MSQLSTFRSRFDSYDDWPAEMEPSIVRSLSDRQGDIVLQSSDDHRLIRVPFDDYKANFSVFVALFHIAAVDCAPPLGTAHNPIQMTVSFKPLDDFIRLMLGCPIPGLRSVEPYDELFALCEGTRCHFIGERAARYLVTDDFSQIWKNFCIADRYKDLVLARAALKAYGDPRHKDQWAPAISRLDIDKSRQLSLSFLLGLIKALEAVPRRNMSVAREVKKYREDVSAAFEPSK